MKQDIALLEKNAVIAMPSVDKPMKAIEVTHVSPSDAKLNSERLLNILNHKIH